MYKNWLCQCVHTWFGNEANGYANGDGETKARTATRGHPIVIKTWNPRTVCGRIHAERISEVQTRLSGGTEKHLGQYGSALGQVFTALSEEEKDECTRMAVEWNKNQIPEEVQRKWIDFLILVTISLLIDPPGIRRRWHRMSLNGRPTCRTRLELFSLSLGLTRTRTVACASQGWSLMYSRGRYRILIYSEGMRQATSTSSQPGRSIGKVRITLLTSGPSSLRVCSPTYL